MKTYLKIVPFSELNLWDVKIQFIKQLSFSFNTVKLGDILSRTNIEWVNIEDDKKYPILGVRGQGQGVYINRVAQGNELTMKRYQKSKANHFFYCKVRTVKGQMGVVYPEFEKSFGSSNMQYLKIDLDKINTEYLELLLKVKSLTDLWDTNAIGADGRHFNLKTLLNLKIPLPPLSEQNRIVKNYNEKINLARKQEKQAEQLETDIENYLFEVLGIEKLEEKENKKGLQFVNFQHLERWDILAKDLRILNGLKKSKYELKKIGDVYSFPSKSWKKSEHKTKDFRYIELGAIDIVEGIKEVKNIQVIDAPSRATQQVEKGDLIIGTTRPYLKRFTIIEEKNHLDICSSGFSIIEPSPEYDLRFLREFLFSYYGIEQLKNRMTGATYPAITNSELKEILIPLPKIKEQKQIANHISEIKEQIKNLKTKAEQTPKDAIKEFEQEIFTKN